MALPLLDLTPLILWLIAFALCIAVVYVSKAFFGVTGTVLGKLPVVGGWIDATAHHIEQRITNVFGSLAAKSEARVGASWHSFARLIDHIGRELATHANAIAILLSGLPGFGVVSQLYLYANELRHRLGQLAHRLEGIGHDVVGRIHSVERGIGADVLPRIRGLERGARGEVARERARARAAERMAERDIHNLWKWTRSHTLEAGTLAFAGAVAWALARLGAGWVRCPTASKFFKKRGCNAWNDLDALLALGEVVGLLSLVELAREEQKVVGLVASGVRDVLEV